MTRIQLISFVLLCLAVIGCTSPQASRGAGANAEPGRTASKKIAVAIRGEPRHLNDRINSAGPGGVAGVAELSLLVSAGLADVDSTTIIAPRLGAEIPTLENGLWQIQPDGRMSTIFRLRPNLAWHDGAPMTASDLAFTIQVGQDKEIGLLRDRAYDFIEAVEEVDPAAVVVRWNGAYVLADTTFSVFAIPLPRHLLERPFNEDKANFIGHSYWNRDFVGNGPFKVKDWVQNSHMVIDAFDRYVLGRPKLDEIEVRFFLDPNVIIANLLSGTVDMTMGRGISLEQGVEARDQWREGTLGLSYGSWLALFPQFVNPNPPVIAEVRFRRALMHAVDRKDLIDTILYGQVPVPHSFMNPALPEFRETESAAARYEYDPRRAAQLIEEVGYVRGADGFFAGPGGRLTIEVRTTTGDDLRDKLLFATSNMWQQNGVGVENVIIPRQRSDDREYRSTRPGFELVRQPNDLTEGALRRFHGQEAALPENNFRGQNRTRYASPELDSLVDRYLSTVPRPERMEILRQMVRHVSEQLPIMGLTYGVESMLIAKRIVNVDADVASRNGHEWDVR
jgi:peptide/nickel transport system substrate-binding protein